MQIAIITGASSGLGAQFARSIAQLRHDVDEIWLVARRKDRLERLAAEFPQRAFRCIGLDLAASDAYDKLSALLKREGASVKILINNAGYERSGRFGQMDASDIQSMIGVNVFGTTMVQRACAPHLSSDGIVVITCSVSSFAPLPGQAVYAASKRYVYALGKALREELQLVGPNVMLLCPGNMDTEMNPRGQGRQSQAISTLPYLDMGRVAARSLKLAERGRAVYTPGALYKCYRAMARILPSSATMAVARRFF